jgi:DNA-binding FrmR family transcriptional regulator
MMSTERGYTASKDQLQKRLARIEGQVRGISKMVEEDRYCIDILTQISAIQAALDKVALGLLDDHTRHCLLGEGGGPKKLDAQVAELMGAVGRLVHR